MQSKKQNSRVPKNDVLNSAFIFWIAYSTMDLDQFESFVRWANNQATLQITGTKLDKGLIKQLAAFFDTQGPANLAVVIKKAQELAGLAGDGEWNPHTKSIAVLDAISKL